MIRREPGIEHPAVESIPTGLGQEGRAGECVCRWSANNGNQQVINACTMFYKGQLLKVNLGEQAVTPLNSYKRAPPFLVDHPVDRSGYSPSLTAKFSTGH